MPRFTLLDSMRGAAALAVVCFHLHGVLTHDGTTSLFGPVLDPLFEQGRLGVEAFFVLSGFVIAHSLRPLWITPSVAKAFVLRRSVRLDPTYWAVLFATFAVNGALAHYGVIQRPAVSAGVVLANMFYVQGIFSVYSPVNVAWTLCAEVQFYLLFMLLVWAFQWLRVRLPRPLARLVVFAPPATASLLLAAGFGPQLHGVYLDHWHLFFLGTMVYWSLMGVISSIWFWIYTFLMLLLWNGNALGGVGAALAIYGFGRLGLLESKTPGRVLPYLGSRSYSLYMIHVLVGSNLARLLLRSNYVGEGPFALAAVFLFALAASIAAGEILYRLVERPTHRIARQIPFQILRRRGSAVRNPFTQDRLRAGSDELAVR